MGLTWASEHGGRITTQRMQERGWVHRCVRSKDKRDWYWRERPRQHIPGAKLEYAYGDGRWCWECPECGAEWESEAEPG